MMTINPPGIRCPIDLFPRQEEEIKRLTQAINGVATTTKKIPYAESLIETVQVLLACEEYSETSLDCQLCRQISLLRRRTFCLVMKAGRMDEHRRHLSE